MTNIEYITRAPNSPNKTYGATAKESVEKFLNTYKNRKLTVREYRNGVFSMQIGGDESNFYKMFNSRKEAKEWSAAQ